MPHEPEWAYTENSAARLDRSHPDPVALPAVVAPAVKNVWETRHRLLLEQLQQWTAWLSGEKPTEPGSVDDLVVRLLTGVVTLLKQHEVNKRGQCKFCGWTTWRWRLWRPRRHCTVFQTVDRAMKESIELVWWELFGSMGRKVGLEWVKEWLRP